MSAGETDVRRYSASRRWYDEAVQVMPGGVNSSFRLRTEPVPLFFEQGQGPLVTDVDGNRYVDYVLGMGPAILGHSPARVVSAVADRLKFGQLFAGQTTDEVRVARRIQQFVPCAEQVRFGMSGTEMVQAALRLARASTGRAKVVKFEGHYHGWVDTIFVSTAPPLDGAHPSWPVEGYIESAGQSVAAASDVVVLPWNDLVRLDRYFRQSAQEIAAVIMEPICCNTGVILPVPGYLEGVRELCERYGVVLVFDEVITGFRVHPGGAQALLGVTPDLTVLAKALGGGFPVAALCGRRELMEMLSGPVVHGGTYNANVMSIAAADAVLSELLADEGSAFASLERTGDALRQGLSELGAQSGLLVSGVGSVFNTTFADQITRLVDYRSYAATDLRRQHLFLRVLQDEGVRVTSRGTWFISTAHGPAEVELTLERASRALKALS